MSGFFWLASYPKSGNTWLRLALQSLMHGGVPVDFTKTNTFAPIASNRLSFDNALGIESSDMTEREVASLRPRAYEVQAQAATQPLFSKVHDAWLLTPTGEPMFPPTVTLGTVYIVRDPRDVAISYAHHRCVSIDQSIRRLGDPDETLAISNTKLEHQLCQRLLTWSGHVESWLAAPGRDALLVHYEAMLEDPVRELSRVAAYFDLAVEPEVVTKAVAATRFDVLQAAENHHGLRERLPDSAPFFRRGIVGGWRDSLSAEQVAHIVRDHSRVMARLGYLP